MPDYAPDTRMGDARPPPGLLVLVTGPSGAGKDTLLEGARSALANDPIYRFPRRIITRTSGMGEEHGTVGLDEFLAWEREGRFFLTWRAHGLAYGLPIDIDDALHEGRIVPVNVSRCELTSARRRARGRCRVVHVSAPPHLLAARLRARGREDEPEIIDRLARRTPEPSMSRADIEQFDNSGGRRDGISRFTQLLQRYADNLKRSSS